MDKFNFDYRDFLSMVNKIKQLYSFFKKNWLPLFCSVKTFGTIKIFRLFTACPYFTEAKPFFFFRVFSAFPLQWVRNCMSSLFTIFLEHFAAYSLITCFLPLFWLRVYLSLIFKFPTLYCFLSDFKEYCSKRRAKPFKSKHIWWNAVRSLQRFQLAIIKRKAPRER